MEQYTYPIREDDVVTYLECGVIFHAQMQIAV